MKPIFLFIVCMFLFLIGKGTGTPVVEYTVGVKIMPQTQANKNLLERIRLAVVKEGSIFLMNLSAIQTDQNGTMTTLVKDRMVEVNFYIEDIIHDERGSLSFLRIVEGNKQSPHFVEISRKDSFDISRKFAALFDRRADNAIFNPDDVITLEPDFSSKDFHYLKGLQRFSQGQYMEAISYLDSATRRWPLDHKSFYAKALCYKKAGDKEKYKQNIDKAIALSDHVGNYIIELGNYHLNNGDAFQAIGYYNQFENDPRYYDLAAWNLHVAFMKLNQTDKAMSYLKKIQKKSKYFANAQRIIVSMQHQTLVKTAASKDKDIQSAAAREKRNRFIKNIKILVQSTAILAFLGMLSFILYKGHKQKVNLLQQKKEFIGLVISIITFLLATFDSFFKLFAQ